MSSRACLLPATGDPFVELFWLHFFKERWGSEIDTLYYLLNSPVEEGIAKILIEEYLRAGAKVIYTNHVKQHGEAIRDGLAQVKEQYVMLIENDAIVFRPGHVRDAFKYLESGDYDIVGSDRGSASLRLIDAGKNRFGLKEGQHGDRFPHFYPCFFFADKSWYTRTDEHFEAKHWNRGELIHELGWTAIPDPGVDVVIADTFGWASIQMRARSPKVRYLEQYHAYPHDRELKRRREHLWDGKAGWMHYGSVSTGLMGCLTDEKGVPLQDRKSKNTALLSRFVDGELPNLTADPTTALEYERRCGYWLMCVAGQYVVAKDSPILEDFRKEYIAAIVRFAKANKLDWNNIVEFSNLYRELLNI